MSAPGSSLTRPRRDRARPRRKVPEKFGRIGAGRFGRVGARPHLSQATLDPRRTHGPRYNNDHRTRAMVRGPADPSRPDAAPRARGRAWLPALGRRRRGHPGARRARRARDRRDRRLRRGAGDAAEPRRDVRRSLDGPRDGDQGPRGHAADRRQPVLGSRADEARGARVGRASADRGARPAPRRGTGHPRRGHRREPRPGRPRRVAGAAERAHSDPLQRRRPRDGRVRDRARRGTRGARSGQGGPRVGGRDPSGDAGLTADRLGVRPRRDPPSTDRRRGGGIGDGARRGRPGGDRCRPHRREWRHRQQDRNLLARGTCRPPPGAVLRRGAVLDDRSGARLGCGDSDRGARRVGSPPGGHAANRAGRVAGVQPGLRRDARPAHRGDHHRARCRPPAVSLLTAREYHDRTAHSPASVRTGGHTPEWDLTPFPFKVYPELSSFALPRELDPPAIDTLAAIAGSPTSGATLMLSQLAPVLYHPAGVPKRKTYPGGGEVLSRAAASTGALYQTEVYVAVGQVAGLDAGLYHFSPGDFALRRLRAGDVRDALATAAGDDSIASRAATVLLTGIYWRNAWQYHARADRPR